MSTRRTKKRKQLDSKRTKAQEKQVIMWAVGITAILLVLSYFYFRSRF